MRGRLRRARLRACPGSVCDEHSAAWSPTGRGSRRHDDAAEQSRSRSPTVQRSQREDHHERTWAAGHARWSSNGSRIALSLLRGCPQDARTPQIRSHAMQAALLHVVRAAAGLIPRARGGGIARRRIEHYEYDWSPDDKRFVVTARTAPGMTTGGSPSSTAGCASVR